MAEIKRNLAVVIGINQYSNGIPELKTAVNDAKEIAHTLETKYQYQVLQLINEEATGTHLQELFAAFEQQTLPLSNSDRTEVAGLEASGTSTKIHPDSTSAATLEASDRLLFYFAGHGIALDTLDNADGPVGFLVPQDALMDNDSSLLSMKRLHDALLALPCRHLLVILECCFAGAFRWAGQREVARSQKMYRERYERFISGCAQQVITSAADDEKAADALYRFGQRSEHEGHSPFAELLLKGLSGEADYSRDGAITATELYVYIQGELSKTNAKQTPGFCQLKRHDKGEYIFPIANFEPNQLDQAPVLDENANPYKGLESFEENDNDKFFGRKALTQKLQEFVTINQLTVVLGASGSGKSSLVKAGLIPLLKQNQDWRILPPIRTGESPFIALNKALETENLPVFAIPNQVSNNRDNSQWYEQGLQNLSANLTAWRKLYPNSKLLLVIDQSEEVVTLCRSDKEREMFLNGLARALKAFPDWLRIVLTLRSDFEPQFRETALEPYWSSARFIVPAMTREELREAIVEPASAKVMYFEPPTLVDQLIDEVVQMPGALPLLSFTLSELYLKYIKSVREGKRNNRAITQEDYEELGGVARSLTQRADCEYDQLVQVDSAYEQTVRHVMLRMVAVGGGELARRWVFCTELEYPPDKNMRVNEVIERFVAARLLVKGRDIENQEYVEPAHDVLVRGWQKLRIWKDQELGNLLLQRELTPTAHKWATSAGDKKAVGLLWDNDPRLPLVKQVLESSDSWLNSLESEFVQQSIKQKRKNATRLWSSVAGAFVVLSSATLIAIFNYINAQNKLLESESSLTKSLFVSGEELEALVKGVETGNLLKKQIFPIKEETKMRVVTALQQVAYGVSERNRLLKHEGHILSVSFSPDKIIASSSADGTINLWHHNGELMQTLPKQNDRIFGVSFSQKGQTLISASQEQGVKVWQRQPDGLFTFYKSIFDKDRMMTLSLSPKKQMIATADLNPKSIKGTIKLWSWNGRLIRTLKGHGDRINNLSFSPDGQMLASASTDNTIKLWSIKDGKLRQTIRENDNVFGVRFVDNQTLASASADGTVKLWTVNGKKIMDFKGRHSGAVNRLALSPDSKTLASASADGTINLWSLKDGKLLQTFKGHNNRVNDVSFSPDGKMIASASDDRSLRIWSLDNTVPTLQGRNVSFSPSPASQIIVSGDKNGNVKLWSRDGKFQRAFSAHKEEVINQVSFSPNGQLIATASTDKTVKLWHLDGTLFRTLKGHKKSVISVSFSSNGKMIATSSFDKTVKLWHLDGTPFKTLQAHQEPVTSVSFSPNGKMIATSSFDKTVKLWRLDGDETPMSTFKGHKNSVLDVSFSPNGKVIASAGEDGYIRLWRLNGQQISIPGHQDHVYKVKFSPSGETLVSASLDQTIKLWSLDGKRLQILQAHAPIIDISFSPDSKILASADTQEKVILWDLDLEHLLTRSCSRLPGYFQDERTKLCN